MKLAIFSCTITLLLFLAKAVHKTNLQQMIQTNAEKKKKPKISDTTTFSSNTTTVTGHKCSFAIDRWNKGPANYS